MPRQEIPKELREHEAEIVARAVQALSASTGLPAVVMSDPDANIERMVDAILQAVEPMIAVITLRAFAVGAERVVTDLPVAARSGALAVVNAARDVADGLEQGVVM